MGDIVADDNSGAAIQSFAGQRIIAVTVKDGKDYRTFGKLLDVKDGFLVINVDQNRGTELVALTAIKRIEFPNLSGGKVLTPDRPPLKVSEGV